MSSNGSEVASIGLHLRSCFGHREAHAFEPDEILEAAAPSCLPILPLEFVSFTASLLLKGIMLIVVLGSEAQIRVYLAVRK